MAATLDDVMQAVRELGERTERRFDRLENQVDALALDVAGIKSLLSLLVPMVSVIQAEQQRQAAAVAHIDGRIADMPTARDFGRLEGRVAEMSERLPTTIGYNPPVKPAA